MADLNSFSQRTAPQTFEVAASSEVSPRGEFSHGDSNQTFEVSETSEVLPHGPSPAGESTPTFEVPETSKVSSGLVRQVWRYADRYGLLPTGGSVVVGVSGGPDSLCLLHLLRRLAPEYGFDLHVAHLDHGLRGTESAADAAFVAQVAAEWGITCTVGSADVRGLAGQGTRSVEEAGRQARYRFLLEVAASAGSSTIAVGHNADDQAETVLMHLLRGSGPAGLAGMRPKTGVWGGGGLPSPQTPVLIRPLLATPRSDIETYCAEHGLQPRCDRTNEDRTFYRNRLRHELLPLLEAYNPAIRAVLGRTAEVLAADHEVLQAATEAAWERVAHQAGGDEVYLDLSQWRALPLALQRATLRRAISHLAGALRNIGWEHVERAVWLAREGTTGQLATLPGGLEMEISYDFLRVVSVVAPARTGEASPGEPDPADSARFVRAARATRQPGALPRPVPSHPGRRGEASPGEPHPADSARFVRAARATRQPGALPRPLAASPLQPVIAANADRSPQIAQPVDLAVDGCTPLGGGWQVTVRSLPRAHAPANLAANPDPWTAWLDADAVGSNLILRPRRPGDRFQPQGLAGHSVKLNEYMIDLKVPRRQRAGWPVLEGRQGIAWVAGLRVDERAAVRGHTRSVLEVTLSRVVQSSISAL